MISLSGIPKLATLADHRFVLIAGPCVVENEPLTLQIAEHLVAICQALDLPLLFKASFRKANRSRVDSFTGIGDR
ncbi:MAG: 3-deoxy-8-phosphooctulonate synthase, partial [Saprospiraceae bacterium]|nr:3-deoxy-8-phosphooctulonate synthase [Saprospiraceae bacterium]